jgi:transposase
MRYDLSDFEWNVVEPVLPKGRPGPKRKDDRRVMNGIFWVLRTGAPWRDLPERYGPLHDRLQSLQSLAKGWRVGSIDGCGHQGSWR